MVIALSKYDASKAYPGQKTFDCEHQAINGIVANGLKQQVQRGLSVAYVLTDDGDGDGGRFIGFCTLMAASIGRTDLAAINPPSLPQAVPVTKLAMLGVDKRYKGQGCGRQLLRHAIRVMLDTAQSMGMYGLYLDADPGAVDFYLPLDFKLLKPRQEGVATPMFLHIATVRPA